MISQDEKFRRPRIRRRQIGTSDIQNENSTSRSLSKSKEKKEQKYIYFKNTEIRSIYESQISDLKNGNLKLNIQMLEMQKENSRIIKDIPHNDPQYYKYILIYVSIII
jgi:hypothetical protein